MVGHLHPHHAALLRIGEHPRVIAAARRLVADGLSMDDALGLCDIARNADDGDVLVVDVANQHSFLWRREGLTADSLSSGVLRLVDVSP